jgi:hypothetical protein
MPVPPNKTLHLGFAGLSAIPGKLFGELQGVHGVCVSLPAEFVSGQMISLAVSNGRGGVGVGRKVVEFCESIVRALGHGLLLPFKHQVTIFRSQAAKLLAEIRLR